MGLKHGTFDTTASVEKKCFALNLEIALIIFLLFGGIVF